MCDNIYKHRCSVYTVERFVDVRFVVCAEQQLVATRPPTVLNTRPSVCWPSVCWRHAANQAQQAFVTSLLGLELVWRLWTTGARRSAFSWTPGKQRPCGLCLQQTSGKSRLLTKTFSLNPTSYHHLLLFVILLCSSTQNSTWSRILVE